MQSVAERRAFLMAFERKGTLAAAIEATGTTIETHQEWMREPDYATAYHDIVRDLKNPPKPKPPVPKPPPKPSHKKLVKRRQKAEPEPEPEPEPPRPTVPQPAPRIEVEEAPSQTFHGERGYVKVYVREGQEIIPPAEPEPKAPPRPPAEPDWQPSTEVTVASDEDQMRLIDEFGELHRKLQMQAIDSQRFETLKRAIKAWFDQAPGDADGTVQGGRYLLHLSAREKERQIRSIRELVDLIGLDAVLDLAVVPITRLEDSVGKARVAHLIVEKRTGSRRIRCIPKYPAALPLNLED